MSIKIKINDRFSVRDIKLLNVIDFILEEIVSDCDEIYDLSNKTTDKEIELINAEKEGEYNSVADEYNDITNKLTNLANDLYENKFIKVYQSVIGEYVYKKEIGKYKYKGGAGISDLVVGKIYSRGRTRK